MTRPTSDIILENMKPIIAELLGTDKPLTRETDFLEELGADSLDMVEIAMAFEEKFLVGPLEDHEIAKIRTIADAINLIEEKQTPSGTLYQRVRIH